MTLQGIKLTNFRSYQDQEFSFPEPVTLVVGPNASGKTNLLEAIYVLATTKSFRAKDRDLKHHEADFYRIVGLSDEAELVLAYSSTETGTTKQATRDGAKRSLLQHIGSLGVVLFEPSELTLLTGTPDGRRRYLDAILCQTDMAYLRVLTEYKRVLRQRNSLLESFATEQIKDQIFAWDIKLTTAATQIFERRQEVLKFMNQHASHWYDKIADEQQPLKFDYLSTVDADNYAENFMNVLQSNLMRDLAAGFTTIGPHREDFKARFKNNDIHTVASRGEVRTAVLALKLVEIQFIEEHLGRRPILLLDDVFSELDQQRRIQLLQQLDGYQAIITTTDADHIQADLPLSYHLIETGAK